MGVYFRQAYDSIINQIEILAHRGYWLEEAEKNSDPMYNANGDIVLQGIEKYESVLIRALNKVEDIPENLRFMCFDAIKITNYFNNNVDQIYLNFSDPWPKKKHSKRRLTSPIFLDLYNQISKDNINIKMKTDNKGLFAYSLETLNNNNFHFNEVNLDLPIDFEDNVVTEYENKFRTQGVTINYLDATKPKF